MNAAAVTGFSLPDRSNLSHAYIIASADSAAASAAAWELAALAVCSGSGGTPCGVCKDCLLASEHAHPDIITVEREDAPNPKEKAKKRDLTVAKVREVISDARVIPARAKKKVYIFEEAGLMNVQAQNAALKLLEEPPAHAVLILCTPSADVLLPTVRSRCTEISINAAPAEKDDRSNAMAEEFAGIIARGSEPELVKWCMLNSKLKGDEAAAFFKHTADILADVLCGRRPLGKASAETVYRVEKLMEKSALYAASNVNVRLIMSHVAAHVFAD